MRWFIIAFAIFAFATAARAQPAGEPLHAALLGYAQYQGDVSALSATPVDSQDTLTALMERMSRQDCARVARGWIAYGALTAAQSPSFVAGVQSRSRAAGRAAVIRQLSRDLTYARRRPPGSSQAIGLILTLTRADAARLASAGARFEDIARTIETTGWAAQSPEARATREARMRAPSVTASGDFSTLHIGVLSAAPLTDARAFGGGAFWDAIAQRQARPQAQRTSRPAAMLAPPSETSVDRMLTLAGLFILGATQEQGSRLNTMLDDTRTRECLALEQLQYRQCASVAHSGDEDAACLARHGLERPSMCFTSIAR